MFTIHHKVSFEGIDEILKELDNLKQQNHSIILKLNKVMGQNEKLLEFSERLDAATNEIASDLQKLRDEVAAGSVSDETLSKLDTTITRLEDMGKDPEQPVPDAPTPEEPTL
jgi:predicted nuclease with TOPRIM domain